MNIEKQESILELLKEMIKKYKQANSLKEKEIYLKSINNVYHTFDFALSYRYESFLNQMTDVIMSSGISDDIFNYINRREDNYKKTYTQIDYKYLRYLISKIKAYDNPLSERPFEVDSYFIEDYLKTNSYLLSKYKQDKANIIYDDEFISSFSINLYGNKNIILMNNYDIIALFHEFLHGIYTNIMTIYSETPNILGELALQDKYRINSLIKRWKLFRENVLITPDQLIYIVGTILANAIINKYGSDFNTVYHFMNLISNNHQINFTSMLELCNISEDDIINSFNRNKRLSYIK